MVEVPLTAGSFFIASYMPESRHRRLVEWVRRLRVRRLLGRRILGFTAAGSFIFYLGWNLFFLVQARIPPSILSACFGIPSPTTGGSRSFSYLLEGDFKKSLQANAFTIPISLLFLSSLGIVFGQLLFKRPLSLPRWIVWSWLVVLLISWVFKILGNRAYW